MNFFSSKYLFMVFQLLLSSNYMYGCEQEQEFINRLFAHDTKRSNALDDQQPRRLMVDFNTQVKHSCTSRLPLWTGKSFETMTIPSEALAIIVQDQQDQSHDEFLENKQATQSLKKSPLKSNKKNKKSVMPLDDDQVLDAAIDRVKKEKENLYIDFRKSLTERVGSFKKAEFDLHNARIIHEAMTCMGEVLSKDNPYITDRRTWDFTALDKVTDLLRQHVEQNGLIVASMQQVLKTFTKFFLKMKISNRDPKNYYYEFASEVLKYTKEMQVLMDQGYFVEMKK